MTRLLLALPLLAACQEYGGSCVSAYGPSGLSVHMTVAESGTYTWTMSGDTEVTCTAVVPDGDASCDGDDEVPSVVPDGDAYTIESTVGIAQADTVHLTVERDDATLLDEDVSPSWELPDPDTCPDTYQAVEEVDLTGAGA